jgi:hypothetical protein
MVAGGRVCTIALTPAGTVELLAGSVPPHQRRLSRRQDQSGLRCRADARSVGAAGGYGMRGAITGKDVILNSVAIVRLWGVTTYLHCLWAAMRRRPSTFLGVLYPDGRCAR